MSRFFPLIVKKINRETADAVSVALEVPAQHKNDFNYIQGQYLTFKFIINGEELRRSYSICSSPFEENDLVVAIKKVQGGRVSSFINDSLKEGITIDTMTPMGNFHSALNPTNKKQYVLFAGGSGITPMMSIIKAVLKNEPSSKVVLFYGNQNESTIIFKKQLQELEAANSTRLKIHHILNEGVSGVYAGIMDKAKDSLLIKTFVDLTSDNEFFVCGPTPMMDAVKATLEELKVTKERIHIEYFTTLDTTASADIAEGVACKATIILDGDKRVIDVPSGTNVLEAAMNAGLDVPYACRGGSCCTCRALLQDGKVEMMVNFALLDSEVEQGYILTCQSLPQTPTITVNYDKAN